MVTNVHLYPSDMTHESRLLRESSEVVDGGLADRILIIGTDGPGLDRRERVDEHRTIRRLPSLVGSRLGGRIGKIGGHVEWTLRAVVVLLRGPVDIVTCHGLTVLPIGVLLRRLRGATLVYSPHELETETRSTPIPRPMAKRLERWLIPKADTVIVVGWRIADWYRDEYDLDEVHVVRNIPTPVPLPDVLPTVLKDDLALPDDEMVFLYQGLFTQGRSIELLLAAWNGVPADRHLVFLGYGPLTELVEQAAAAHPNVHYLPAVPPDRLADYTVGADVGLCLNEKVSLSYYYSLPNKVFEYIHAGVPIVSSDFPEMSDLINHHECGWPIPVEEGAVRSLVTELTPSEIRERANKALAARRTLDWTDDRKALLTAYRQAVDHRALARR